MALDFTYGKVAVFSNLPIGLLRYLFIKSVSAKTSQGEFCYSQTRILTNIVINGRCGHGNKTFQEMRKCGCLSDVVRLKGSEIQTMAAVERESLNHLVMWNEE